MAKITIQELLSDPHIRDQMLEFVRKYGVMEMNHLTPEKTVIKCACFDGLCSDRSFYKYLKENPEFKQAIDDAKTYYRQSLYATYPDIREEFIARLREVSKNGITRAKQKVTIRKNPDGSIKEVIEEKSSEKMPPRDWMFQNVLGVDIKSHDE